MKNAEESHNV